jgi:erythromycin esterase|tara:strand:- start:3666 stop:4961 length:1296 start_codon:yes stop_codon:yes gene_type:complete
MLRSLFLYSVAFLLAINCNSQNKNVINWLTQHSLEISNTEVDSVIDRPINTFPSSFISAKIYGLGGSSHQHAEFNKLKSSITKYLITNHNLNFLFFEESYGAAHDLNEYLNSGEGDLRKLVKEFRQKTWQNSEVLDFFQWLKSYNETKDDADKVSVYGIDPMFNYNIVQIFRDITDNKNFELTNEEEKILKKYSKEVFQPYKIKNINQEIKLLTDLQKRIQVSDQLNSQTEDAVLALEALKSYISFINEPKQSVRDRNMMSLIVSNMEQEKNFKKGLVWSHNLHIKKTSLPDLNANKATLFPKNTPSLGKRLKKKFKKDYYSVGFDFGFGKLAKIDKNGNKETGTLSQPLPNTFSEVLFEVPFDFFFFDFQQASKNKSMKKFIKSEKKYLNIGGGGLLPKYAKKALAKDPLFDLYDGLIYVREVSLNSKMP